MELGALQEAVGQVFGEKPHPDVPELKVNQYDAFGRVAARMFYTSEPHSDQVQQAFHSLTQSGVSPAEFERVWDVAKPLANRLLDRDPTLHDLMLLATKQPVEIQSYYQSHPHPEAPDVGAGQMALYRAHAEPISRRIHGRDPNNVELRRFALGNYSIGDVVAHYTDDGSGPGAPQVQGPQQ